MAINKKLIHFKKKEDFDNEVANKNILDHSIVFIQDSKEISTHGTVYKSVNWNILEGITDLSMVDVYGTKHDQTTANCYIVKRAGTYKFPLVYGNAIKNGFTNLESYTVISGDNSHNFVNYLGNQIVSPYIETDTGSVADSAIISMSDTDVFGEPTIIIEENSYKYIQFEVLDVPNTGANAVISVRDSNGVIMWNWHIWVWKRDLTPISINNNNNKIYKILPVNLATKLDSDGHFKNWFYQWGRSIPLTIPESYNSTNNHINYGNLNFTIIDNPTGNYQQGITNPNVFYTDSSSTFYNWFGSKIYYNLWNSNCTELGVSSDKSVKTVYDPCPVGFKVPSADVFTGFTITGYNAVDTSQFNVVGNYENGWKFKSKDSDNVGIFFPSSGFCRSNNGLIRQTNTYGYVWTSGIASDEFIYHLNFGSDRVYPVGNYPGSMGFSIRPVLE